MKNNLANWYTINGQTENLRLRSGGKPSKRAKEMISKMTPCASEVTLYRGLGKMTEVPQRELGFLSTSESERRAMGFVGIAIDEHYKMRYAGTMLILSVQPGVPVYRVGGPDSEVVIAPGAKITETRRTTQNSTRGQITYIWCNVDY